MAGSINKVILIGRLGMDPEVRHLEGGSVVSNFNIATSENYTNKAGEKVENTEWHRLELWDKLATLAEKYLKKGDQIYVEGKLRTDNWQDKEGNSRSTVRIRVQEMTFLGSPNRSGEGSAPAAPRSSSAESTEPARAPASDPAPSYQSRTQGDDDLPF